MKHVLAVNTIRELVCISYCSYLYMCTGIYTCVMFLQWLQLVCPSYVSVLASSGLHAWTCSCKSVRLRLRQTLKVDERVKWLNRNGGPGGMDAVWKNDWPKSSRLPKRKNDTLHGGRRRNFLPCGNQFANRRANKGDFVRAQRLINLEIPVLVRSLKSSNVELGQYLDGRLFKCCLSAAANP